MSKQLQKGIEMADRVNFEYAIAYKSENDFPCDDYFETEEEARGCAAWVVEETNTVRVEIYRDADDLGDYQLIGVVTK